MMSTRERGTALLLVLWVTVLLAALLAGVAAAARSHSEAALYGAEHVRAQLAAEAGLAHAVAGLRVSNLSARWVPDGRPYTFTFDGAKVTTRVVDVSGMLDLNAASPELLQRLFAAAGANALRARQLADAVADRRGGTPNGAPSAVGDVATATQPQGPFRTIDTLARLPGMDAALYAKVAQAVTIFSGRNFPDVSYANPLVLAAVRDVNLRRARTLVDGRRARPARRGVGNAGALGGMPAGALMAGYGGTVERVFSSAQMPDGTRAELDVTLRFALTVGNARPYKVLDWRADAARAP